MKSSTYLVLEFFLLFILLPVSLVLAYNIWIKAGTIVIAFIYLIGILLKFEHISFSVKKGLDWSSFWKRVLIAFFVIIITTSCYVFIVEPSALFYVPLNNPGLFLIILFVYSIFSVWPQEIIYRTFFFERYSHLFKSKALSVFINATVFMLAHLFFKNTLVLILTFVGGLLFGFTYLKFKSTTAVTIEHALYGNWLFTVGMGQMLAFPGMDT